MPRSNASGPVRSKRAYHHGNLREDLIRVGLELIAEQGVRALTLREIGNRLGVSRMAPYRHFADKSALLQAISRISFTHFAAALEAAVNSKKGHLARLEEMAVAYVRFAAANRTQFEVMFGKEGVDTSAPPEPAAERAFSVLLTAVGEAQKAGKLAGKDPGPVARLLWATVHGISLLGLESDPEGTAAFTRMCAKNLFVGLQPKSNRCGTR